MAWISAPDFSDDDRTFAEFVYSIRRNRGFALKAIWLMIFFTAFVFSETGFAQKLVDPHTVAPQFREAAEKRLAEQIKQRDCARKADEAKVLPRDRAGHITKCLAEDSSNTTTAGR